jgi:hypothetical protein
MYRNSDIVGVYLWAVAHDRPTSWAAEPQNWPKSMQRPHLPSQSTLSRRLRAVGVERLFEAMEAHLGEDPRRAWVKMIDAKPLPIGGYSKDRDATWGRGVKALAKGYKLYAIWANGPLPLVFALAPMHVSEPTMAGAMIENLQGGGYLLGDKIYDSNRLYDMAARQGHQLVAPRKRPQTGLGHRRHSPQRLRAMELLQSPFGQALFNEREHIERNYGWLTSFSAGLAPLPAWVRTPHRVRLWVRAKLLINAIRMIKKAGPVGLTMLAVA